MGTSDGSRIASLESLSHVTQDGHGSRLGPCYLIEVPSIYKKKKRKGRQWVVNDCAGGQQTLVCTLPVVTRAP